MQSGVDFEKRWVVKTMNEQTGACETFLVCLTLYILDWKTYVYQYLQCLLDEIRPVGPRSEVHV